MFNNEVISISQAISGNTRMKCSQMETGHKCY